MLNWRYCVLLTFMFVCIPHAHAQIIISEVYPAPESGFEWVELCNTSDSDVELSNYTLKDAANRSLYVPNLKLKPQEYVLATASSVLNNSGDSISLYKGSLTIDSMSYDKHPGANNSYIFCDASWIVSDNATPAYENASCALSPTPIPLTASPTRPSPTTKPSGPTTIPSQNILGSYVTVTPSKKISSFTQKHAVQTPPSATPAPTVIKTIIPVKTSQHNAYDVLGNIALSISIFVTAYLVYRLALVLKDSYNETHDT